MVVSRDEIMGSRSINIFKAFNTLNVVGPLFLIAFYFKIILDLQKSCKTVWRILLFFYALHLDAPTFTNFTTRLFLLHMRTCLLTRGLYFPQSV